MSAYLVRPRSSIADPSSREPRSSTCRSSRVYRTPRPPQALIDAIASIRPVEPELPIILTLAPVPARSSADPQGLDLPIQRSALDSRTPDGHGLVVLGDLGQAAVDGAASSTR